MQSQRKISKSNPTSIQQAIITLDDGSIFDIFCEQLLKDVSLCGLPSEEIDFRDINTLIGSLKDFVMHRMERDAESLRALLYRIDLDEKMLVDLVTSKDENGENIANAIVIRELQKVLYRLKGRLD